MTFLTFLTFVHIIGCFWIFIAKISYNDSCSDPDASCSPFVDGINWLFYYKFDDDALSSQYMTCFYWSVTTFASVGYGDIHGINFVERIINLMIMLGGCIFFSIV
jgi:hypothetical protein